MARLLAAVVRTAVVVLLCAVTFYATSLPGDQGTAGTHLEAFVTGDLSIANSRGGAAILRADALAPGGSATGTVTLSNTGSLAGTLSLASALEGAPASEGAALLAAVSLAVTDVTADPDRRVYTGRLDAVGVGALTTLGPAAARTYRFDVLLPDADDIDRLQGARGSVVFGWTLTAKGDSTAPAPLATPALPELPAPVWPWPATPSGPAPDGACSRLVVGTARADRIVGGAQGERIFGRGGADRLAGRDGRDCLSGGAGNDRLSGGRSADRLDGGTGRDDLTGGAGHDTLAGGIGADTVHARDGERDTVDCGPGFDRATVDRHDRVRRCEHVYRPGLGRIPRPLG